MNPDIRIVVLVMFVIVKSVKVMTWSNEELIIDVRPPMKIPFCDTFE